MPRTATRNHGDAAGAFQQPGSTLTISSGNRSARIEDPREICRDAARAIADGEWEEQGVDPWPVGPDGEAEEWIEAHLAQKIGERLIGRIVRFEFLTGYSVAYRYRHKESWESKGRIVYGRLQKTSGLLRHFSDVEFVVQINWLVWSAMTPWQKVALIYHELRHAAEEDGKPATNGHHFEGFFDELEVFGTETYREWQALEAAAGRGRDVQYHLEFEAADKRGLAGVGAE